MTRYPEKEGAQHRIKTDNPTEKVKRRRDLNKKAAQRCRERKEEKITDLEKYVKELMLVIADKDCEIRSLKTELTSLQENMDQYKTKFAGGLPVCAVWSPYGVPYNPEHNQMVLHGSAVLDHASLTVPELSHPSDNVPPGLYNSTIICGFSPTGLREEPGMTVQTSASCAPEAPESPFYQDLSNLPQQVQQAPPISEGLTFDRPDDLPPSYNQSVRIFGSSLTSNSLCVQTFWLPVAKINTGTTPADYLKIFDNFFHSIFTMKLK